jgi:hypothetical protein
MKAHVRVYPRYYHRGANLMVYSCVLTRSPLVIPLSFTLVSPPKGNGNVLTRYWVWAL